MSLHVSRLSKRYGDKWILRDISFNAERGKVTGIFGASGSGKSSILRAIAGIDKAGGSIMFDSNDVTTLGRVARNFHITHHSSRSFFGGFFRRNAFENLSS